MRSVVSSVATFAKLDAPNSFAHNTRVNTNGDQSRRMRSWRSRIGAAVAVGVVTLVLLEAVLRLFGLASPIVYERDAAAGFRLKPNQHVRYLGNIITINGWGVRDPRPLDAKQQEGVRRIVVLGDSVTWGGIRERQERLFTSVLERALSSVEVVNAGVNGYSVARMVSMYEAHLKALEPDIIVVYAIAGDFVRPVRLELTGDSVAFPERRPRCAVVAALRLAQVLAHARFGWAWLEPPEAAVVPAESVADDAENLRRNLGALRAFSDSLAPPTRLLVVLAATRTDEDESSIFAEVSEALEKRGIEWVRLDSLLPPSPHLFVDGVHLSTEGHRLVGQALAAYLSASGAAKP